MTLEKLFDELDVNLYDQIEKYASQGKKIVGIAPVYAPEELVYASGMIPIGIWGSSGEVNLSKEYFPAFYASIVLRIMDMGLEGRLNKLSAIIVPGLSDSLKGLSQNWKRAIKEVPCLYIGYGQNRKIDAGIEYNRKQYEKLKGQLEELTGEKILNEDIETSINIYNNHRKALAKFNELASKHLNTVKSSLRARVMDSSLIMDKNEHLSILNKINDTLENMPEENYKGKKIVTTGILANDKNILKLLDKYNLGIVDDNVNSESGQFDYLVDENSGNPLRALSKWISDIEGSTLLCDPKKLRGGIIAEKVKKHDADGVLYLLTKFSESEEFDYPIIKKDLDSAGIKNIKVEVDQQMSNYEQASTALETFADMI